MRKKEKAREGSGERGRSRVGSLARLIAEARRERGLSRQQLAALVGVDVTTVTGWENGKYKPRDGAHRAKLAAALNVEAQRLYSAKTAQRDDAKLQIVDAIED